MAPRKNNTRRWFKETRPELHDGKPCTYCEKTMRMNGPHWDQPSRDHVKPQSRGGNSRQGIVMACKKCNEDRGDISLGEWLLRLIAARDHRAIHVSRYLRLGAIGNEPASFPASSSGEQAAGDADLDDAGRARDTAG